MVPAKGMVAGLLLRPAPLVALPAEQLLKLVGCVQSVLMGAQLCCWLA